MMMHVSGKEQPAGINLLYSQELEERVLGNLILYPEKFERVATYLKIDIFYFDFHQQIYDVILTLNQDGQLADLLTVDLALRRTVHNYNPFDLTQITYKTWPIANIEEKCLILNQFYFNRKIQEVGREFMEKAETEDALELLDEATRKIEGLWTIITHHKEVDLRQIVATAQQEIRISKDTGVSGIRTWFNEVDDITLGRHKGDLVILAGRPSHGKTTLALCEAFQVSKHHPVAIFSLEMPNVQLMKKLISLDAQVSLELIRTGRTTDAQYEQVMDSARKIAEMNKNIFMYDISGLHINDLTSIMKKIRRTKGVEVAYVDYIQLMSGNRAKGASRDEEIGSISRGLKKCAKDLNMCMVGLSQLGRAVELRADKRPQLSDLRESGNLENDADVVQSICCPEKYGIEHVTIKGKRCSTEGIAEISILKNRNGRLGTTYLNFQKETSLFTNYKSDEQPF